MKATLDGQVVFDDQELTVVAESWKRGSAERTIAGLDGVLSIDLGLRGRKVIQRGVLRAASESALRERISEISGYMDGVTHTLTTDNGEQFDNLRVDCFEVGKKRFSGNAVCCDYEIRYTQLRS